MHETVVVVRVLAACCVLPAYDTSSGHVHAMQGGRLAFEHTDNDHGEIMTALGMSAS